MKYVFYVTAFCGAGDAAYYNDNVSFGAYDNKSCYKTLKVYSDKSELSETEVDHALKTLNDGCAGVALISIVRAKK